MTASDDPDSDVMPSGVSGKVSMFDRFATNTAEIGLFMIEGVERSAAVGL
ncbi:hypothetical protein ACJEIK_16235 [Mycobacterium sp. SMC-16]